MAVDGKPRRADSLERLGTETAFSVLAHAKQLELEGRDIIHLEIGEQDFDTPAHVCEAAVAAIRAGQTHYPAAGLPELRAAAADCRESRRSDRVATGAKPFLFFTVLATCNPGDEVIYPDPGFPIYESAISWSGARTVPLPLHEERDFAFDPDELAAKLSPRTKLVILNSPHNPTGGAVGRDELAAAAQLIGETGASVLSDEVYSEMLLRRRVRLDRERAGDAQAHGRARRALEDIRDDGLALRLRIRAGRARRPARPLLRQLDLVRSAVHPARGRRRAHRAQGRRGGDDGGAPRAPPPRRRRAERAARLLLPAPRGAFYAFPNGAGTGFGADELARRLLDEAGVAVLAGSAFGRIGRENLAQALERTRTFLETTVPLEPATTAC